MSCKRSFRVATDLPCIPHPCNSARPGLKLPRGINATYWNQIRYKEIRAQRRYPWVSRCVTYTPCLQECNTEIRDYPDLRLGWTKSGFVKNAIYTETLLQITDPRIQSIVWYTTDVIDPLQIVLLPGPRYIDLETLRLMSAAQMQIIFQDSNGEQIKEVMPTICFAPYNVESYKFFLETV